MIKGGIDCQHMSAKTETTYENWLFMIILLSFVVERKGRSHQLCPLKEVKCRTLGLLVTWQVFHNSLPGYLSDELEKRQRRTLRIIYPGLSYAAALKKSNLFTLYIRRQELTKRLFTGIVQNSNHKLHHLLPTRNSCPRSLRHMRMLLIPVSKWRRDTSEALLYLTQPHPSLSLSLSLPLSLSPSLFT